MAEMADCIEFFTSNRGAQKLAYKGFQYCRDKKVEQKIYWKCDDRSCKGRIITTAGEPVSIIKETPHSAHGPNVAQVEVKKAMARMKDIAAQGQDAPARIINRELQSSLPAEFRPYLPKDATVKRAIQRERRKKNSRAAKVISRTRDTS